MNSDRNEQIVDLAVVELAPPRKGCTLLSWIAIVGITGAIAYATQFAPHEGEGDGGSENHLALTVMEMQGRLFLGAYHLPGIPKETLAKQTRDLDTGPIGHRLRYVVLAGEFEGPEKALETLAQLRPVVEEEGNESLSRVAALLSILYAEYAANRYDSLIPAQREELRQSLGWFGELALSPPGIEEANPNAANAREILERRNRIIAAAQMAIAVFGLVIAVMFLAGFAGCVMLLVMLVWAIQGSLRGMANNSASPHAGVYAETFAIWLALFFGLHFTLGSLLPEVLPLARSLIIMLSSLLVLCWPVLRGVPWRQVRREIGWTSGDGAVREILLGPVCYAMSLPILLVGLIGTMLLMRLSGALPPVASEVPAHPIIQLIAEGDAWGRALIILLAAVVAPIVEETMFRGVLYRHLREISRPLTWFVSFVCSALISSVIFASIHPQRIEAWPALAALAFGFCLAREWRGSLLPSMVAHGVNNALITTVAIVALGG